MERVHIVITGRSNTGKSSLINHILGQEKAIVSEVAGTTTDPVKKSFEIPGVAAITLVDTAGIDDKSELGPLRTEKTISSIHEADIALLLITANRFGEEEERLIDVFQQDNIPFAIIHHKSDQQCVSEHLRERIECIYKTKITDYSSLNSNNAGIISILSELIPRSNKQGLLEGVLSTGQTIMLVIPIDSGAPTGRLILPQVQVLRSILDHHCTSIVLQPDQLECYFSTPIPHPDLVITDSQVFGKVAVSISDSIPLTSFSIVMAHYKGSFKKYLEGTPRIDQLREDDRILILESCSHHASCEDIGRVKLPALLERHAQKKLKFDFIAGTDQVKRPITEYALVIQCGGCMITSRQLSARLGEAIQNGIPVTNYGMVFAWMQGIYNRVTEPFRKE